MPHLRINDKQLEYQWFGPRPQLAPTLVFLHEGLGCVELWRDFPERVASETGCGALVYSRAGYGKSGPVELPRPLSFMHDEALVTLPAVLEALNVREAILVGHSDGGSIALIHAGQSNASHENSGHDTKQVSIGFDDRIDGLILLAPHVFVEEISVQSIAAIAEEYRSGDLKHRLQTYHGSNVDCAFWGWNQVWLNPQFRSWNIEEYLPRISLPMLVIQGADDQYGTTRQVQAIQGGCPGPVTTLILGNCGHSPHLEQPEKALEAVVEFVGKLRTVAGNQ